MLKVLSTTMALAVYLSISATGAFAQAFGIEKGTSIGNLEVESELEGSTYIISVPKPHPEFDSYMVKATPSTGVCYIAGLGKNHENDKYGGSVRDAFSKLLSALESRYGNHKFFDFLAVGGIWDGSEEWVMSIRQNERFYAAYWDEEEKSDMPEGLVSIELEVSALSSDSSYIALRYKFDNIDDCAQITAEQDASGL